MLLVAVHHRLFPVHPGLRKNIKRAPRRCGLSSAAAGWRCHPENSVSHEIAYPRMQLDRVSWQSLTKSVAIPRLKCFLSDFAFQRLAGLAVDHQQTNLLLRHPKSSQEFDDIYVVQGSARKSFARCGAACWCVWQRATGPTPPSRSPKRRLFASTNLAANFRECLARLHMDKTGFEHLAAPSSPSRQIRGLSGSHLSSKQMPKSGRERIP